MGSQSDWQTMRKASDILEELLIPHETKIVSAHRTPKRMAEYADTARARGLKIIIAGAGGSAPKHVQQFVKENHLRWDSLGEFLAIGVSLEHLSEVFNNNKARVLAKTLDIANTQFLAANKSPSRKCGELDNRGSHFYLALYWAQALAHQDEDAELRARFTPFAALLAENEAGIVEELNDAQGKALQIGGYFRPDTALISSAMRPSSIFNSLLATL